MFRSLYGKWMAMFLAGLVAAMALLSGLLYQRIREDKIQARLDELTNQARDIAYLAAQSATPGAAGLNRYMIWKSQQISSEFDAFILIVDRLGDRIPIGDDTLEISADISPDVIRELLQQVSSGYEVRVPIQLPGTNNPMFAVGVPYVQDGRILGAVFILTSEQNIQGSYQDIIGEALRVILITLALGSVLGLIACRFITRPLREMAQAADQFARGDFTRRVKVQSRDEVGRLAQSFNSMAEDLGHLEQTRRDFVANVSHELRSPLTSIQGFLGGMLDGTIAREERDHYLGIVQDETRRLNTLINALLDLSRIESGQTPLNRTVFDVNERIVRVLIRQEARINERNIDVQVDFEKEDCPVNADADRIEQVLINLIDNAVKYGKDGGTVVISTRREKDMVRIAVQDDGQGIEPEDVKHVFDRFYMAEKAHTSGKGTGLGLAIVKGIMDQHGQRISVTSTPGQGARFEFTLEAG